MNDLRLGINLWNWVLRPEEIDLPLCQKVISLGFSHLEVPVLALSAEKAREIGYLCRAHDLTVTACYSPPANADFLGDERAQTEASKCLAEAMDVADLLGATALLGPLYNGRRHVPARSWAERAEQQELLALRFATFCQNAKIDSLALGLEPVNRYRSDLINTVEDFLSFLTELKRFGIGSQKIGLLFDSYQAQIEERDLHEALAAALASACLLHLHLVDAYRLPPDLERSRIDWIRFMRLIKDSDYRGALCLELFAPGGLDSSQHDLNEDRDEMAIRGLNALRQIVSLG